MTEKKMEIFGLRMDKLAIHHALLTAVFDEWTRGLHESGGGEGAEEIYFPNGLLYLKL
ncbi:MAG: hypothetical protein U5K69_27125 [Balneolaceae bacterium]|nr:hypothetical protein [Balneolaceae bacterium]